jgi:hypothetical protein
MLISLATLRLLARMGDSIADDALDDLGINGMPQSDNALVGRMTRTVFVPWWALASENKLRDDAPISHWDRAEMLN